MSAISASFPQFTIATTAGALTTDVAYTALSVVLGAGTYRVSGAINGVSSAGVGSNFSVSAPLISANPLIALNLGAADDYTSVEAPISFTYTSNGIAPLVVTLTATFASGTFASALRNIRFTKIVG